METLRLATRKSPLALWQARHAALLLRRRWPGLRTVLVPVTTCGDADLVTPLAALGSVGVFVREVQAAVQNGHADAGVHSGKDLPTASPEGLCVAAWLKRVDPRDALIVAPDLAAQGMHSIADLPQGAVVGTSSLRRQAQLLALRPDLRCVPLRGNVATRLAKCRAGDCAATIMAMAGLSRLGLARAVHAIALHPQHEMTPAPAQGAIAIDCRRDDRRTRWRLAGIADAATTREVTCERHVLADLHGGCSLPLGCFASGDATQGYRLTVRLGSPDLRQIQRLDLCGRLSDLAERALVALKSGSPGS